MKIMCFALGVVLAVPAFAAPTDKPVEWQVASIDAGRELAADDRAVLRAKRVLAGVSKCYAVKPMQATNMAADIKVALSKQKIEVDLMELLDGALTACADPKQWKHDLSAFMAHYMTIRQTTGFTHHKAVRAYIGIQVSAINATGGR